MTPRVVEHCPIAFPDFETRFSTAPVTKPVSGKPLAPPVERPVRQTYTERHVKLAPVKLPRRTPVQQAHIEGLGVCPGTPNGQHRLISKGPQVHCTQCAMHKAKHLLPKGTAYGMAVYPPIVLANPEAFGPCPKGKHHLVRHGSCNGKPKARCKLCEKTGDRVADAVEAVRAVGA